MKKFEEKWNGFVTYLKNKGRLKRSPFRGVFEQITAYRLQVLMQSRKRIERRRNTMYYGKPLTLK